jgi:hypothetical protein
VQQGWVSPKSSVPTLSCEKLDVYLALMIAEFLQQVLSCANLVSPERGWREKFSLAPCTPCHRRDLADIPQNSEAALCHGGASLSQ